MLREAFSLLNQLSLRVTDGRRGMTNLLGFAMIDGFQIHPLSSSLHHWLDCLLMQRWTPSLSLWRNFGIRTWLDRLSLPMMPPQFWESLWVKDYQLIDWCVLISQRTFHGSQRIQGCFVLYFWSGSPFLEARPSNGQNSGAFWKSLWHLNVPNKIKSFAWRASCNILSTKAILCHRKVLDNPKCEACGLEVESSGHLF